VGGRGHCTVSVHLRGQRERQGWPMEGLRAPIKGGECQKRGSIQGWGWMRDPSRGRVSVQGSGSRALFTGECVYGSLEGYSAGAPIPCHWQRDHASQERKAPGSTGVDSQALSPAYQWGAGGSQPGKGETVWETCSPPVGGGACLPPAAAGRNPLHQGEGRWEGPGGQACQPPAPPGWFD
jgi:hypothetical protein